MEVRMTPTSSMPPTVEHNRIFHSVITPMTPLVQGGVRQESDLNRTDLQELLDHQHLLNDGLRPQLELVRRKPEIYPERFFDPDYVANSALLLASSYPGARRYAFCGVPNRLNLRGACKDHKFCPHCNYVVREQAVRTYVPAFTDATWHFLTLSFAGSLPFDSHHAGASADCWDACGDALGGLVADGTINGVHWTEEIAVLSFLPLRVMPHVHALVDAGNLGDDDLGRLHQRLSGWRNARGEPVALVPDLDLRPIHTDRSLLDRLRYLYKPISLAPRYRLAWDTAAADGRARAWELNSQARELAAGVFDLRKRRDRMHSKGTLNPKAKQFIGIPRDDRAGYADHIRELQEQPPEYPEYPDPADN